MSEFNNNNSFLFPSFLIIKSMALTQKKEHKNERSFYVLCWEKGDL